MKSNFSRKGLSDVVATVLIILLALAAIAIVWAFVQPSLQRTGQSVDLQNKCLAAEVKPVTCTVTGGTATVNVARVRGDMNYVVAVVENDAGEREAGSEVAAPANALSSVSATVTGLTGANFTATAAAVVVDDDDPTIRATCAESLVRIACE